MSYIGNEPIVSATRTVTEVTATAGQTVFNANGGYTVGYLDVFLNGAQLQTVDFTATNGSSVTLTEAAQVNDVVRLVAWGTFSTSNLVSPNYTGTLTGGTGVVNIGSGQIYKSEAGNVGIGTSSPNFNGATGTVCHINNAASGAWAANRYTNGSTGSAATDGFLVGNIGAIGYVFNYEADSIIFGTSASERMRINSSGSVLVGLASDLAGITSNTGTWRFASQAPDTSAGCLRHVAAGVEKIVMYGNGSAYNSTGTWGTISDARLKENIVDATPKLDKVNQLRVVNFNLKSDPELKQIGFIAQEIEEIFPGLVQEGNEDGEGGYFKSVKTTVLVPILVKAIQEQQEIIQSQADTITAMEARLTALEVSSANASGTSVTQENK
jgi:hypothetical protein